MSGPVGNNPYRASGVVAAAAGGGAISWCTTVKTGAFCVAAGSGYLVNTTSTAFTATLPCSPAEGDQASFVDFAGTFDSNALTLGRGGKKIKGACCDATVSAERGAVTIIYTGTTQGWIQTSQGNDGTMVQAEFVAATGGNQPTATGCIVCTNYKVHTFTGTGPLCVSNAGNSAGSSTIDYLVVAGGAGGGGGGPGTHSGGGGGAGGYRESNGTASGCYTTSPLGTGPCTTALTAAVTDYTITVGAGGAGSLSKNCKSTAGDDSVFSTITSAGGGTSGEAGASAPGSAGGAGGSGGGGGSCTGGAGGAGNTPPTTPNQGFAGGSGKCNPAPDLSSGGGGGATAVGANAGCGEGGDGGAGATSCITASPVARAGGGGGGANVADGGGQGTAGGGNSNPTPGPAMAGTVNTGGGAASGSASTPLPCNGGGAGGSGYVVVRYKFQ